MGEMMNETNETNEEINLIIQVDDDEVVDLVFQFVIWMIYNV
jgi:hypothetical protein